jgi:hypothetical protein
MPAADCGFPSSSFVDCEEWTADEGMNRGGGKSLQLREPCED